MGTEKGVPPRSPTHHPHITSTPITGGGGGVLTLGGGGGGGGVYSSSSRAGMLGRTLWPQNSTSMAETEKGGQNSTMTPQR